MVMNRDDYVKEMMDQYLSNRGTYEIITKEEATEHLLEASNAFVNHISKERNSVGSDDMKNITRCLEQHKRIPVMCGLGKLHKRKIFPTSYRLVVTILGSPFHGIGR